MSGTFRRLPAANDNMSSVDTCRALARFLLIPRTAISDWMADMTSSLCRANQQANNNNVNKMVQWIHRHCAIGYLPDQLRTTSFKPKLT